MLVIRLKKHSIVVATKKVHCHERMENQYEEIYVIVGTSNTKQVTRSPCTKILH